MDLSSIYKVILLLLKINTWILSTQNSNSPLFDLIIYFHDFTIIILTLIILIIFFIITFIVINNRTDRFLLHGHLLETLWTTLPVFVLIAIAIPSIKILYLRDDIHSTNLTIKTIGHQWYWRYEYSDFYNINFDSFIIPSDQLKLNEFRLLDVDNRCILPLNYNIRIITTSIDVIHAWTVPSLGIKIDSTPGRLNQSRLYIYRPGLFFGQCSEICGINHRFIPIVVESTRFNNFKKWLNKF